MTVELFKMDLVKMEKLHVKSTSLLDVLGVCNDGSILLLVLIASHQSTSKTMKEPS
jgi:hypothetical protein